MTSKRKTKHKENVSKNLFKNKKSITNVILFTLTHSNIIDLAILISKLFGNAEQHEKLKHTLFPDIKIVVNQKLASAVKCVKV